MSYRPLQSLLVPRAALALAIGIPAAAVSFAGFSPGYNGRAPPLAMPAAERFVELAAGDVATVELRNLRVSLPVTGTLRPEKESRVKAKVAGEIKQVMVREGETVKAGQVLARSDSVELEAMLRQRLAELDSSRAQAAQAERTLASHRSLIAKGFVSRLAFENAQSQYQMSAALIRAQQAQVELARTALADAVIHAPMDGVVAQSFVQAGDKAAVDSPLFAIVNLAQMEVEVAVPASDIPQVRLNQDVDFGVEGFEGREFSGVVQRVNPTALDGSRSIVVHIAVANPDAALRGGMFAKGSLTLARLAAAKTVPIQAVRHENGRAHVYLLAAGALVKQPVVLGATSEELDRVEVLQGLDLGQQVIKTNLGDFADGSKARIGAAHSTLDVAAAPELGTAP